MICHQRLILNEKAKYDTSTPYKNLKGFLVKEISRQDSKNIILEYEWLKTMGRPVACYGLFVDNKLHGAINFGIPSGHNSRNICGKDLISKAICLERGACSHLTPKNAASYFIRRAIKLAHKQYGWEIFFAYSDEEAGEIGTIYQACNWYYLGSGVGRPLGRKREVYCGPNGLTLSERSLPRRKLKKSELLKIGWTVKKKLSKHKYVWFEGSKKRKKILQSLCRYEYLPYPKRNLINVKKFI